ncbi:MAG: multifunctional CCA addition/repair protein, partial [Gammaproteobacteria bacterium]|nr:multifunctional CCA addition/repair protein [Gammaproteobacteria bacterium]
MKTYLVGGAVRDELLGLKHSERDWVVTGATPEYLESRGFRQVGSSFPVFLHPQTGEEYALARTERKKGHGYHGFSVEFDPEVTIEQDLQRRDLTVNAMARGEDGQLVDPWGGQQDLQNRVLRHVSPAFAEDPLRVLRVARFAARFASHGFSVHPDTMEMMRDIVASGEMTHLVPERSWSEIRRAMGAETPSIFLSVLRDCGALAELIPELDALYGVPQSPEYHPEVDTGLHTEMAIDAAARDGCEADTVFAVLLHDLGKGLTPESVLPAHHGHEQAGLPLVNAVCERFRVPNSVHRLCRQVCAWHLKCHRMGEMTPNKVMKLLEDLDALRSRNINEFVCACAADKRGRTGRENDQYP